MRLRYPRSNQRAQRWILNQPLLRVTDRCNVTSRSLTLTFSPFHSASLPETIDYPYRVRIVPACGEKKEEEKTAEGTDGKLAEMKERNEED